MTEKESPGTRPPEKSFEEIAAELFRAAQKLLSHDIKSLTGGQLIEMLKELIDVENKLSQILKTFNTTADVLQKAKAEIMNRRVEVQGKLLQERFKSLRSLRNSLFGDVKLMLDKHSNRNVVVKFSNKQFVEQGRTRDGVQVLENVKYESKLLHKLKSLAEKDEKAREGFIYICHLLAFYEDPKHYWTVLEFCDGGEFFDLVQAAGKFDNTKARHYFRQLLLGLRTIHMGDMCHLDLSLENLLLTKKGDLKICDFGLARDCKKDERFSASKDKPGKTMYMAPEIFNHKPFFGQKADIWSLGVILFLMVTGAPPWELPSPADRRFQLVYEGQIRVLLNAWNFHDMDPRLVDLLIRILCPVEKRISLEQILSHPWVTDLPLLSALTLTAPPPLPAPSPSSSASSSASSASSSASSAFSSSSSSRDSKYSSSSSSSHHHPMNHEDPRREGETQEQYFYRLKMEEAKRKQQQQQQQHKPAGGDSTPMKGLDDDEEDGGEGHKMVRAFSDTRDMG